jgi:hypothetical protein
MQTKPQPFSKPLSLCEALRQSALDFSSFISFFNDAFQQRILGIWPLILYYYYYYLLQLGVHPVATLIQTRKDYT